MGDHDIRVDTNCEIPKDWFFNRLMLALSSKNVCKIVTCELSDKAYQVVSDLLESEHYTVISEAIPANKENYFTYAHICFTVRPKLVLKEKKKTMEEAQEVIKRLLDRFDELYESGKLSYNDINCVEIKDATQYLEDSSINHE